MSLPERQVLQPWSQSEKTEQRLAERAPMILALAEGKTNQEIAADMETRAARVSKWRTRFARPGTEELKYSAREDRPRHYNQGTEQRILAVLEEAPLPGFSTWSGMLVSQLLGDDRKQVRSKTFRFYTLNNSMFDRGPS